MGGVEASSVRAGSNKIVFVNRYFYPDQSATSRLLSDLAFRLAAGGMRVSVVTSRQLYGDPNAALAREELTRGVQVHRVATFNRGRSRLIGRALDYASFHVAAGVALMRHLEYGDVVVAKTDPPLISVAVARAAAARGAVLVNWLQDLFPEVAAVLTPNLLPRWLQYLLLAARDRSLRRAAVNIVLSPGMRERLLARAIDASRIRIAPNWADTSVLTPKAVEDSANRRFLQLTGRFVVGYSGNLGRAHEFETLLSTARLLKDDPQFVFLITGAGAKAHSLRRAVEAAGLSSFVFQDYQPPELLADSLAAADVHLVSLLPALEGLIVPSKLYGILAVGRPAVFIGSTDGDVAREIQAHGCGMAVGMGESEKFAAVLRAWRDDPALVRQMSENARRLALASYSGSQALTHWLALLAQIAPGLGGPTLLQGLPASTPLSGELNPG
jgi:colanic acid biosynthesis glycosyl transferase WcaI